jgi:transposase
MTKPGNKISGLTKERIREQLADETDPKAIKRLTATREYLEGLSPEAIEDKYGWHHQTVYNWLNRFEERGFDAALYDKSCPGRSSKLSDEQFEQFTAVLHESPEETGYDDSDGVPLSPSTTFSKRSISPSLAAIFADSCTRPGLTEETLAGASLCR